MSIPIPLATSMSFSIPLATTISFPPPLSISIPFLCPSPSYSFGNLHLIPLSISVPFLWPHPCLSHLLWPHPSHSFVHLHPIPWPSPSHSSGHLHASSHPCPCLSQLPCPIPHLCRPCGQVPGGIQARVPVVPMCQCRRVRGAGAALGAVPAHAQLRVQAQPHGHHHRGLGARHGRRGAGRARPGRAALPGHDLQRLLPQRLQDGLREPQLLLQHAHLGLSPLCHQGGTALVLCWRLLRWFPVSFPWDEFHVFCWNVFTAWLEMEGMQEWDRAGFFSGIPARAGTSMLSARQEGSLSASHPMENDPILHFPPPILNVILPDRYPGGS